MTAVTTTKAKRNSPLTQHMSNNSSLFQQQGTTTVTQQK